MKLNFIEKLSLKKKIIIVFGVLISVVIVLTILVIIPSIKNIKEIATDIMSRRADVEKKYIKGMNLNKLTNGLKTIEPQLNKLDDIFVEENKMLDFITTLEKIAEKNKITQKINPALTQKVSYDNYKKIPLQIFSQGNYINQIKYLDEIESLNYYINVKLIELTGVNSANGEISMLLIADSYWK